MRGQVLTNQQRIAQERSLRHLPQQPEKILAPQFSSVAALLRASKARVTVALRLEILERREAPDVSCIDIVIDNANILSIFCLCMRLYLLSSGALGATENSPPHRYEKAAMTLKTDSLRMAARRSHPEHNK
jgi:hypothetical protein